jgi:hypothetical protein
MKNQDGYSVYMMLHLAKDMGRIAEDQPLDIEWEEAERMYADFEYSKYDVDTQSEYCCIVDYLTATNNYFNMEEAIDRLRRGYKIRNVNWKEGEYLRLEWNGWVRDENSHNMIGIDKINRYLCDNSKYEIYKEDKL